MSKAEASPLETRAVLAGAWPLFQVSWPSCLPLALVGVAASAMPQAEARVAGTHDPQWWGLLLASLALMQICYGAVLLRQLSLASGTALPLREVLRRSVRRLPAATAVVFIATLPAVAGTLLMASGVVALGAAVLLVPGVLAILWLGCAWHVALWEPAGPLAALGRSVALVRGRARAFGALLFSAAAAVLVFVLLTGILLGVVMGLAGISPEGGGSRLGFARVLYALVLAVPVVWLGAVSTVTYRRASGQP